MYKVFCDDQLLYLPGDQELVIFNTKLELADNKSGSFEFDIPAVNPIYDRMKKLTSVIRVEKDGDSIFYGRILSMEKNFYNTRTVVCEGELAYLLDSIQEPKAYHSYTVRSFLNALLAVHNMQTTMGKRLAVTFNSKCAGESGSFDNLSLFFKSGSTVYAVFTKKRANDVAGKTFIVPAGDFYVYWHTDASVNNYYGFSIDSVEFTSEISGTATVSSLPSYTAVETKKVSDMQSAHNPYANSSNLLWHYTHTFDKKDLYPKMFVTGMVTMEDSNDSIYRYTNWENTLDDIQDKLVDRLGGHLRIRHSGTTRYLDYIADYDNTNTQVIEFGSNLLDYTENADASEIATRVIPLGKRLEESSIEGLEEYTTIKSVNNSVPYIESTDAVKVYGVVTRTVSFEDVGEPANLKKKAEKYLSDIQFENLSLTCNAVDLNMVDVDIERIKLGDSIRVVSKPHGMDRYFPVTALTIDLQNPQNNTVTLGTSVKAGISERTTNQNDSLVQKIQSLPPQSDTLRMAIENATALITAATTGHVVTRPEEILIMDTADKDTAKKVWRWNLNGLGYSSTGYNGTFGTAITMDGKIVGKYIAARSIYADSFIAGELQTAWNGITDYIQLKNGELQVFNTSDQLVSKFNYNGEHFYRDGTYVGKIGTNKWSSNAAHKGLVFDLEYTGKYMAWCYQKTSGASSYTTMLCFSQGNSIYTEQGLHLGCDFYGEWNTLYNIKLSGVSSGGYSAFTGTIPIIMNITDKGNGAISWTYSKLQVKNGIIVGYWN